MAVTGGTPLSRGTSALCSPLQRELVAILNAHRSPQTMVIIYTDFQAALGLLQQTHHSDNVWFVTFILGGLQSIVAQEWERGCTTSPAA